VVPLERLAAGIESAKPVKVLDATDEAEVVIEVDPPKEADEESPAIEAVT
jgi:hypothetical protein